MARISSLNVLLTTTGKDYLAEQYGAVIENVQKACVSQQLKNVDLSGTPGAGTYEAKRFENKASKAYGTARAANAGEAVKAKPVTVPVDVDKEIVVEVEQKDVTLYGVDNLDGATKLSRGHDLVEHLRTSGLLAADQPLFFIGDTLHDAEVGTALGATPILVDGGHQNGDRLRASGHQVVPSLLAAVEHILHD
jgi:hypothetical protein